MSTDDSKEFTKATPCKWCDPTLPLKLTLLNFVHGSVLALDENLDMIIRRLDTADIDDRKVYETLTRLKVSIEPYIDGMAELKVYCRGQHCDVDWAADN